MEIEHFVLATIAWGTFALFLVGAMVGTSLIERTYRTALAVFVVATVSGFSFSFLAGFSIGRFTAVLPLIVTASPLRVIAIRVFNWPRRPPPLGSMCYLPGSSLNKFTSGESR